MVQSILIGLLLLGATFYLIRLLYKSFTHAGHCDTGCGKCGAMDIGMAAKKGQHKQ